MKGFLRKKDSGWVVQYFELPTINQLGWINSDLRFNELPLVKDEFNMGSNVKIVELKEGKEVEFEIVEQYAKII